MRPPARGAVFVRGCEMALRPRGAPRLRGAGFLIPPSPESEGTERRKAHSVMSTEAAARFATRPPSGAPFVAISVPGAVLPGADGALVGPRSGRLSPAFVGAASSHSRQSP